MKLFGRKRSVKSKEKDFPSKRPLKPFYSKVAGVSHKNNDGSSRQKILKKCRVGDSLKLVREPRNKFDKNAVKVLTEDGKQIGYLNKHVAAEIAPRLDKGSQVDCVITDLTGGGWIFKKARGCNIKITKYSLK